MSQQGRVVRNNEYPWLLFQLKSSTYSVNSKSVLSIIHLNDEVTVVPQSEPYIRGIMQYQGFPIKLVDLRALFHMESKETEIEAFKQMIDMRKQDHIHWVEELERCANAHQPFTLATDPHQCAFGRWYDSFRSDSNAVKTHLNRIKEPHEKLHAVAHEVLACSQEHDKCTREECLKVTLAKAKEEYMIEILQILEDIKQAVVDDFREMVIVFDTGKQLYGILVDKVLSVEELDFLKGDYSAGVTFQTQYIGGVAKTKKTNKLVLLIDENSFSDLVE
jgi:chemotaxis signal transduction protein